MRRGTTRGRAECANGQIAFAQMFLNFNQTALTCSIHGGQRTQKLLCFERHPPIESTYLIRNFKYNLHLGDPSVDLATLWYQLSGVGHAIFFRDGWPYERMAALWVQLMGIRNVGCVIDSRGGYLEVWSYWIERRSDSSRRDIMKSNKNTSKLSGSQRSMRSTRA